MASIQQDIDQQLSQIRKNYNDQDKQYKSLLIVAGRIQNFKVSDEIVEGYNRASKLAGRAMGLSLLREVVRRLENTLGYYLRRSTETFFDKKIAVLEVDKSLFESYCTLCDKATHFDELAKQENFNLEAVSIAYAETIASYNGLVEEQRAVEKARRQKQQDRKRVETDRKPIPVAKATLGDLPGAAALAAMATPPAASASAPSAA